MEQSNSNSNPDQIKEAIKVSGLGIGLKEDELDLLARLAIVRYYNKDTRILKEDSKSRDIYVIREGMVSVRLKLPSEFGREEAIYQIHDGQVFGEFSLVDGSPRSATVYADNEVVAYQFIHSGLLKLLEDNPRIGYIIMRNVAKIIANRVRNTNMLWRNTLVW